MNKVSIVTNGKDISGWNGVRINRSIAELADTFELDFSDSWIDQFPEIYVDLPSEIRVDDKTILTGFIDDILPELESDSAVFKLTGRSKTGDLIDCNRIDPPYTWKNINLNRIAKTICDPFGINVIFESASTGENFVEASIDHNETLFDFLDKLAKQRKLLMLTNTSGNLVFTTAGKERSHDSLIQGENIPKMQASFSFKNRFSHYRIKGQEKTVPSQSSWSSKSIAIYADAKDEQVKRYRPKMITASTQIKTNIARDQIAWEAQIRAGRSTRFSINLPTWTQSNGDLWRENLVVYVKAPLFRIDGDYLIESIDYALEESSLYATLNFVDKNTYASNPKETIEKPNKKKGKYGWIS